MGSRSHTHDAIDCSPVIRTNYFSNTPARLGVAAEYTLLDRVWLAPWIGVFDNETKYRYSDGLCSDPTTGLGKDTVERRFAYGLGISVDFTQGRERFGPFLQLAGAREEFEHYSYSDGFDQDILIAFGVAYRYW